ncbi:MAG: 1-acyl-sn-glycerol-3-phosphate acyltransferase [Bacteriovoracaceae bacterium]|jgi:1-acyl-sn-glycerol-3-phosphate acyltransferase
MFEFLSEKLQVKPPKEEIDKIFEHLQTIYPAGEDPWGLSLKKARKNMEMIWPFYHNYFKVRVFGQENVGDEPYLVTSNHSGQIAIDGMLICIAFSLEVKPARILRPMVERFVTGLPFFGTWASEGGAVLGDRQNCINLLEAKQSVLVFPEGVRGVAKNTADFYKLQKFTRGFFRMALSTGTKILPIAVVGAEEFYPFVYHPRKIARFLGLPALPLTPLLVPLPSPVDIIIGKPYEAPPELTTESSDAEIDIHIKAIEAEVKRLTEEGLKNRRSFWANVKKEEKK